MELLQLKYFKALAKEEHMSKTAEKLFISQPSLSLTIKKLEDELGVKLFDRVGRSIKLNSYGKAFLSYTEEAFNAIENGTNEIKKMQGHYENQVLIGIQTPYVWQDLTRDFLKANPGVTLGQRSIEGNDFMTQLLNEEIDFHIGTMGDGEDQEKEALLDKLDFAKGDVYIIVNSKSSLAQRESIFLKEIKDEYIVCRNSSDNFQKYTDRLCKDIGGFLPKVALECDYTLREKMVAQGYGISFSTEPAIRWLDAEGIVPVRIADSNVQRIYQLIWKKKRAFTPIMQKFYAFTASYINSP
ncbi:MAG: LysR family transcriptional regulator [Clostridia bacterium]|nr:LysR family transcriptional regulator [Clostridia bacterium]